MTDSLGTRAARSQDRSEMRASRPRSQPGLSWLFIMAWRDMRRAKRHLALFALAVVSGIAALVAISSFRANLESEMDRQSRGLLGADVAYDDREPFDARALALFNLMGAEETARQVKFRTMAYFPTKSNTRIVRAQAMEGGFPWYGSLDTRPAGLRVADSEEPIALIEDSLMLQFDLKVGDPIKIGELTFTIAGELLKMPGEGAFTGSFAPRVLIPLKFLSATGLDRFGSRLRYFHYQKFSDTTGGQGVEVVERYRDDLEAMGIDVDTVEDQRRQIGRTLDSTNGFLSMIGFVALLLGGVSIAGAVQVYLKSKTASVATLRCLGASARQSIAIYCIQISIVGLLGCLTGALLGVAIQTSLPELMKPFLPLELPVRISWPSIFGSLLFGWLFTSLFALLPLLPLRRISPLRAIRASVESAVEAWRDRAFLFTLGGLLLMGCLFTITQTQNLLQAASFLGGIAVAIVLLALVGWLLRFVLRRLSLDRFPYVWKQALANLYRPENRTTMQVVTLGMGAFLVFSIYVSEQSLLRQGDLAGRDGQPNVILFDIQPDQLEGVLNTIEELDLNTIKPEAIVTMRLQSLNGLSPTQLIEDPEREVERWATRREYRSTYRDFVREDEELIAGEFTPSASLDDEGPIPVSVEQRIVDALDLKLGDRIVWDVQGLPIETEVTSIRKVDWRQMKPNFFVVFPAGVLEAAPAFFVTAAHAPNRESLVGLQTEVVKRYPNVAAVNLTMILESLEEIFDRIGFVIRFMASFTILTGLVALMASVNASRYQRSRESSLLRTLGASAKQIRGIMGVEYALVGIIAGLAGVALSVVAGWALTRFVFRVDLYLPWQGTIVTVLIVASLTLLTGLLNSLGIARRSPLESIRSES